MISRICRKRVGFLVNESVNHLHLSPPHSHYYCCQLPSTLTHPDISGPNNCNYLHTRSGTSISMGSSFDVSNDYKS